MELTGLNLLLIILAPMALVIVLFLILSPFIRNSLESHKPIKKETKDKIRREGERMKEAIKKGEIITPEERRVSLNKIFRFANDGFKKSWKANQDEMGFTDIKKEMKKDIKDVFK